jgi:hypothetical protein
MPVDFSLLPPQSPGPGKPPSKVFWTGIAFLLALMGAAVAVSIWPSYQSTHTVWFWICIIVYPLLIASLIVSRRFSVYEGRHLDALAWNEARKNHIERVFELASVPMSILGAAFVFVDDENNTSTAVADRRLTLNAQPSIAESGTVTARWLKPNDIDHREWKRGPDTMRQTEVLNWAFGRLLDRLFPVLSQIPSDVPVTVKLQVSANSPRPNAEALWKEIWARRQLRPANVETIREPGFSVVESWLDSNDHAAKQGATLVVSVMLNKVLSENPPANSAEAGVALLLAHQDVVDKTLKEPVALLHRPTHSHQDTLPHAIKYALKWGRTQPSSIDTLWLTGIDDATVATVHQALNHAGVISDRSDSLLEVDIDRTIGHAGVTASWLSVALATEMFRTRKNPQLIMVQQKGTFAMAVVAPLP